MGCQQDILLDRNSEVSHYSIDPKRKFIAFHLYLQGLGKTDAADGIPLINFCDILFNLGSN